MTMRTNPDDATREIPKVDGSSNGTRSTPDVAWPPRKVSIRIMAHPDQIDAVMASMVRVMGDVFEVREISRTYDNSHDGGKRVYVTCRLQRK
jgi:hypothetical protein